MAVIQFVLEFYYAKHKTSANKVFDFSQKQSKKKNNNRAILPIYFPRHFFRYRKNSVSFFTLGTYLTKTIVVYSDRRVFRAIPLCSLIKIGRKRMYFRFFFIPCSLAFMSVPKLCRHFV